MSLTLLLDLDDTLLVNPADIFVSAYFQKLAAHLAPHVEPTAMIQALKAGTRQMVQNLQPDCTLKEEFDSVFYPSLHVQPESLEATLQQFYAEVFSSLKGLTRPMPGAVKLVETALQRGYRLAITTTPLFPLTAALQRLEWAGLSPQKYPFALVASFEHFHFAKPNPAFFAEALAILGWPEGPVLVVGDDLINDIHPAQALGIPSFWVNPEGLPPPDSFAHPTGSGDLASLLSWLDRTPLESLQVQNNHSDWSLEVLRSTPAVLKSLCADLESSTWALRPASQEWSPTEILCHLRDVEADVNLPRLQKILEEKNPFLPGVDTDRWAGERDYFHQDGSSALRQFITHRMQGLSLLQRLSPGDWNRSARHAIFGPTQLKELVSIMAGHDQVHVRQIQSTLPHHEKPSQ